MKSGFFYGAMKMTTNKGHFEVNWTIEKIKTVASRYDTRLDFQIDNVEAYEAAIKLKIIDDLFYVNKRLTVDDVYEQLKEYKNIGKLKREKMSIYISAKRLGILEKFFEQTVLDRKQQQEEQERLWKRDALRKVKLIIKRNKRNNKKKNKKRRQLSTLVYFWKALNIGYDNVYKVGRTSKHIGYRRITRVCNAGSIKAELLMMVDVESWRLAYKLERQILHLGDKYPFDTKFDGCTEFRIMSPAQLEQALNTLSSYSMFDIAA